MLASFNRIILFVQNVASVTDFYQKHFGFTLLEEIKDEWAVLHAGNCEIALHKAGTVQGNGSYNPGNNNAKLVFETSADLYQLRGTLLHNQVAMKELRSFPGFPYLYCDGIDTEGNVFQLMQKVS